MRLACVALLCLLSLLTAAHVASAQDAALAGPDSAATPPSPVDEYVANSTPEWIDRAALATALKDAGDNWQELAGALDYFNQQLPADSTGAAWQKDMYGDMLWLIENAPHLDRLELTQDILVTNMELAVGINQAGSYDLDSDLFRRYVLNYRLDDEPVTAWREELWYRYSNIDESSYTDSYGPYKLPQLEKARVSAPVSDVVAVAGANFTVRERGFFGNLAAPLAVDNARAGTKRELAILVAAALRSQGYGTRFVKENRSGESWVEVYTGPSDKYDAGAWTPVYPTAPDKTGDTAYATELCGGRLAVVSAGDAFGQELVTPRYSDTAALQVRFTRGGEELKDYESWTVCAWFGGDWVPLDDLGYPVGEMDYPLGEAPAGEEGTWYYVGAPGEYRLTAGIRYPGGVSHVKNQDFTVEPGQRLKLAMTLDPPADLPAVALVDRQIASPLPEQWAALGSGTHLFIVTDSAEPSTRAVELLKEIAAQPGITTRVVAFDTTDADDQALLKDALLVDPADIKPVVILVVDGKTLVYSRGYNLSIADWVTRALSGQL